MGWGRHFNLALPLGPRRSCKRTAHTLNKWVIFYFLLAPRVCAVDSVLLAPYFKRLPAWTHPLQHLDLFDFILCVWVFWLHVCLCTICMPNAGIDQMGWLDALDLKLQAVVNRLGMLSPGWSSRRAAPTALNFWAISSDPKESIFFKGWFLINLSHLNGWLCTSTYMDNNLDLMGY